jgi:hypothetical protein
MLGPRSLPQLAEARLRVRALLTKGRSALRPARVQGPVASRPTVTTPSFREKRRRRTVPRRGIEPLHPCGLRILSPPRLPVPPPRRAPHHSLRSYGAPANAVASRPLGGPDRSVLAREQGGSQHGSSQEYSRGPGRRNPRELERAGSAEPLASGPPAVHARRAASAELHHRGVGRTPARRASPARLIARVRASLRSRAEAVRADPPARAVRRWAPVAPGSCGSRTARARGSSRRGSP